MCGNTSVASRTTIKNKYRINGTILLLLSMPAICLQTAFGSSDLPKDKVDAGKKLIISSIVVQAMLKQKVAPVYPPIAKTAHVSGTVILRATISKNGSVQDLKVVSGPAMLQQAAFNAVQQWVYKPYMLDNQPTEVETTINVSFGMGGV